MNTEWVLTLPEDACVAVGIDGDLTVSDSRGSVSLRRLPAGVRDAVCRLNGAGDSAGELGHRAARSEGTGALARWFYCLQRLAERQLLRISACAGTVPVATLEPMTRGFRLESGRAVGDGAYVMSRFAWSYRRGNRHVLESPLSHARIVLHHPVGAALVHALSRPLTLAELIPGLSGIEPEQLQSVLGLLVFAGLASSIENGGTTAEDADPALQCWEFHDLLFHTRSRAGRHDGPTGATYRLVGRVESPPAFEAVIGTDSIELDRPELKRLRADDPSFARVQEDRCSLRDYGREPITLQQFSEFLYRVARIREHRDMAVQTPAGPVSMGFTSRPYPAGGGLYELEVYVAAQRCGGVPVGMYHYDALAHRLVRCAASPELVRRSVADAAGSAAIDPENVQMLLILAARVPRITWKYAGIGYALVLKDVGVVLQTMYLAATAMGLAGCAVGCGDSDLFARMTGASYYAETSVGEFLLGSKRTD